MKEYVPKPKTDAQRRALHLGLTWLANHLNETGKTMRVILKPEVEIPWDTKNVKKFLYKPILEGMTGKKSTEDMDKTEPGQVWDVMFKYLGEHHHVEYVPWPSKTVIDEHNDANAMSKKLANDPNYPQSDGEPIF